MTEAVLSVCWEDHTSELASVYKSSLESKFLVDCTISAEGQSLKAHRLVLSACSPYFHNLFQEETGKHPFIILLQASFETLKAVIDFVYRGETRIPEGNLNAFLTLAQALQIKGLNAFSKDNNTILNTNTDTIPRGPLEDNQDTQGQSIHENSENSQQHPHRSESCPDAERTASSISFEEYTATCEDPLSPQDYERYLRCDEVLDPLITVKQEPLFPEVSETPNMILENNNKGCKEPSRGNVESSVVRPSQQQHRQLSSEESPGQYDARNECLLPAVSLVMKREFMDIEESEEPMDDPDVPDESENEMKETGERKEPALSEQNGGQYSRADCQPLENDFPPEQWSAKRLRSRVPKESKLTPWDLIPDEFWETKPPRSYTRRTQSTKPTDDAKHTPAPVFPRKYNCDICGAPCFSPSHVAIHRRKHTGERPYSCAVCGKAFSQKPNLVTHLRTHTKDRPFACSVCGQSFRGKGSLITHMRRHTGEQPYSCDVCGKAFEDPKSCKRHIQRHTAARF